MDNFKKVDISSMLIAVSQIIKQRKEYLNLTVAELSKKSGVSVGVISDLINNRGRVPSLGNFVKLATALNLPEDVLISLIKGNVDMVQKCNKCNREDLEEMLYRYGLSKSNVESLLIQIDALLYAQCSTKYERTKIFR